MRQTFFAVSYRSTFYLKTHVATDYDRGINNRSELSSVNSTGAVSS